MDLGPGRKRGWGGGGGGAEEGGIGQSDRPVSRVQYIQTELL